MTDWDHESLTEANRYLPGTIEEEFDKSKLNFLKRRRTNASSSCAHGKLQSNRTGVQLAASLNFGAS
jgi:hypothetical protein